MVAVLPASFAASVHTSYLQHAGGVGGWGLGGVDAAPVSNLCVKRSAFRPHLHVRLRQQLVAFSLSFLAAQGLPLLDATGCGQNKLLLLFVQKQSELGWIIYGPQRVGGWLGSMLAVSRYSC
jgi:hypothetical protein